MHDLGVGQRFCHGSTREVDISSRDHADNPFQHYHLDYMSIPVAPQDVGDTRILPLFEISFRHFLQLISSEFLVDESPADANLNVLETLGASRIIYIIHQRIQIVLELQREVARSK